MVVTGPQIEGARKDRQAGARSEPLEEWRTESRRESTDSSLKKQWKGETEGVAAAPGAQKPRESPTLWEGVKLGRRRRATPHLALCHLISWHRLSSPLFLEPLSLFPQASPTTEAQDLKEARGIVTIRRCAASAGWTRPWTWCSDLMQLPAWWEIPGVHVHKCFQTVC